MAKINWFPGHMNKALGQLKETLNQADFVVELRDARAPLASANPLLYELVGQKPRLIVLNKSDLADPKQSENWQKYFSSQNCCLVVRLSFSKNLQKDKQELLRALQSNFGGSKKKGPKGAQWSRALRGLVIGIPNVGKSTFINSLVGKQKLKVEDRAGVTKQVRLLQLNEHYSLFDSPGMLWPNLDDQYAAARLTLLGSLKDQVVEEQQLLCFLLQELEILYPQLLEQHYALPVNQPPANSPFATFRSSLNSLEIAQTVANGNQEQLGSENGGPPLLHPTLDFLALFAALDSLGQRLQFLEKGGKIDYCRLLSRLLRDFQKGRLGCLSLEHAPV